MRPCRSPYSRPVREPIAFAKVTLEPGAAATVRLDVHTDHLSFTGLDSERIVEPGEVRLCGIVQHGHTRAAGVMLTGEPRTVRGVRRHHLPVTGQSHSGYA